MPVSVFLDEKILSEKMLFPIKAKKVTSFSEIMSYICHIYRGERIRIFLEAF